MGEMKVEHVLLFLVGAFLVYHMMGRCGMVEGIQSCGTGNATDDFRQGYRSLGENGNCEVKTLRDSRTDPDVTTAQKKERVRQMCGKFSIWEPGWGGSTGFGAKSYKCNGDPIPVNAEEGYFKCTKGQRCED